MKNKYSYMTLFSIFVNVIDFLLFHHVFFIKNLIIRLAIIHIILTVALPTQNTWRSMTMSVFLG